MTDSYIPYKNGTLLIPSGPHSHLFVILTDVNSDGEHLLVSITSVPEFGYYDTTCVLSSDDHEFLKHDSYVYYRKAEVMRATKITRLVEKKFYIPRQDMSEEVTEVILDGLYKSDFTPNFCKKFTK